MPNTEPELHNLAAFAAGAYHVSARLFVRMRLLRGMLVPTSASRERNDELMKVYTQAAAGRRDKLLVLRRRLAKQARAAGLPATLFSLGKINTTRLGPVMWRLDEVLDNTRALRARIANKAKIDALISEGDTLVTTIKDERRRLGMMADASVEETRFQRRVERLLVDTMRFVSAQGLACFDDDPSREARYRLDHVYARKNVGTTPVEPELPPTPSDDADD